MPPPRVLSDRPDASGGRSLRAAPVLLISALMLFLRLGFLLLPFSVRASEHSALTVQVIHSNISEEEGAVFPDGTSKRLTEFLLGNHNPKAPPDGVVEVYYEMELVHILGIDELRQTMTALVYVDERWNDPTLAWNSSDFEGMTKTWLPLENIWVPDIIIFNMLAHEDLLAAVRAPILIYSNGTVETSRPAVYTVSCEINIQHFPLDDQRCALEIASWAYDKGKVRMRAHTEHSLEHYTDNEEWRLLKVTVKEKEYEHEGINVSELRYEVMVKRKPLFYMVTLTFPSYIMCAISIVGLFARFSTSGERQERFTLGVTAILTMAVLSLVVSEKVPHSSTSVPLLVIYFLFNMVLVSVAAMTTGISMRIHRMGRFGQEPPDWLIRAFRLTPKLHTLYECDCEQTMKKSKWKKTENGSAGGDQRVEKIGLMAHFGSNPDPPLSHHHQHLSTQEEFRRREMNGYARIASRLDTILMSFFLTSVTLPVAALFYLMD